MDSTKNLCKALLTTAGFSFILERSRSNPSSLRDTATDRSSFSAIGHHILNSLTQLTSTDAPPQRHFYQPHVSPASTCKPSFPGLHNTWNMSSSSNCRLGTRVPIRLRIRNAMRDFNRDSTWKKGGWLITSTDPTHSTPRSKRSERNGRSKWLSTERRVSLGQVPQSNRNRPRNSPRRTVPDMYLAVYIPFQTFLH